MEKKLILGYKRRIWLPIAGVGFSRKRKEKGGLVSLGFKGERVTSEKKERLGYLASVSVKAQGKRRAKF